MSTYVFTDIEGSVHHVELSPSDTIADMKIKIENMICEYRRDLLEIHLNQKILSDDQIIGDLNFNSSGKKQFNISLIDTIYLTFIPPKYQDSMNIYNNPFPIPAKCRTSQGVLESIEIKYPNCKANSMKIFTTEWEELPEIVSLKNDEKYGLYIENESKMPIKFIKNGKITLACLDKKKTIGENIISVKRELGILDENHDLMKNDQKIDTKKSVAANGLLPFDTLEFIETSGGCCFIC
ncbi:hypothetical protein TRFO_23846 [Tritrichomonas foetus]|uniref:Ubiquitin-like domain-containing protein n=1 Tax=Tritrichomonas foetus TaxID=1144522 RepID=A0A1J4K8I3_9EUKA|nr:hypothetical protein TRFO_23846 [Tritrichomonas foetus]|eukprot:OHT07809.1 hypothetical protein TRFO_23846 [Tritrichomonas foetus]